MADTTGRTIELPIKSNFREGLDVLEYFMSAHGARKGLSDTALRTADSGYLTRRLVDVSQEQIIREIDCVEPGKELPGMYVKAFMDGNEEIESLQERITGRYSCETITDKDGNVIVKANHMITPKRAEKVMKFGVNAQGGPITEVKIRTILTCKSHMGVCAKCYGANMATGEPVQVGEAVGIIAAQSIGEPVHSLRCVPSIPVVLPVTISHRVFPVSRSFSRPESRRVLRSSQSSQEKRLSVIQRRNVKSSLRITRQANPRHI